MTHIRIADEADHRSWNDFVVENTSSASYSLYNLFEWRKVLQDAYSYRSFYLIAENSKGIVGCFPLIYIKSSLLGNRLFSLPFTDHGCGPIVAGQDCHVLKSLLVEADRLAVQLKANEIQINSPQAEVSRFASNYGYLKLYDYFTFVLDLSRPLEEIWCNFKKQVRNSVKKAEKSSVSVAVGSSFESMRTIHKLHVDNMKRLGTPPHSMKFFTETWAQMSPAGLIRTYLASCEGQDIAGIVLLPHRESVRWGAGVMRSENRGANPLYLMLWMAIKWSKEQGYAYFDMGGSRPSSGNYDFKESWIGKNQSNGQIVSLSHLHRFLKENKAESVNLDNPNYIRLSRIWRKYVPYCIAKKTGPYFRKQIAM